MKRQLKDSSSFQSKMQKLLIGLISFKDLPYLKETVPVLEEIRREFGATAVVMDTAQEDETHDFFAGQFSEWKYLRSEGGNIGYGASYNEILEKFPGFEYFLLVTSDVLLDLAAVKKIIAEMEKDKEIAMCSGKIYHWNFEERQKTDLIDSFGISAKKNHHFFDRGQGEKDVGQYDSKLQNFFGLTGAVLLIRTSVIPEIRKNGRIFDPLIWMYKEDIDLSYRLRWLGKKIVMFPEVWAWHARTAGKGAKKAYYVTLNSYKNHLLILKNNFSFGFGALVFLKVFIYEFAKAIYMLILHPSVFFAGWASFFMVKGDESKQLVSPKTIMSYFE